MRSSQTPDFFIVGAPKCGTTALFSYLRTHPQIYFPKIKEPNFYCTDLEGTRGFKSRAEYEHLFLNARPESLIGEASPWYLFSRVAIPKILKENPRAKFIVLIRNPVEMVQSLHSQYLYSTKENVTNLEKAWELQTLRSRNQELPENCGSPEILQYRAVCSLGSQIERAMAIVPKENLHVVLFDALKEDTRRTYQDVLFFLNLEDDNRRDFEIKNRNKTLRNAELAKYLRYPPYPFDAMKRLLKRVPFIRENAPLRRVMRVVNTKTIPRQNIDPLFAQTLAKAFEPEISKLEHLLEVDLAHWRTC